MCHVAGQMASRGGLGRNQGNRSAGAKAVQVGREQKRKLDSYFSLKCGAWPACLLAGYNCVLVDSDSDKPSKHPHTSPEQPATRPPDDELSELDEIAITVSAADLDQLSLPQGSELTPGSESTIMVIGEL